MGGQEFNQFIHAFHKCTNEYCAPDDEEILAFQKAYAAADDTLESVCYISKSHHLDDVITLRPKSKRRFLIS